MGASIQNNQKLQLQNHLPPLHDYTFMGSGSQFSIWDHNHSKQSLIQYSVEYINVGMLKNEIPAYQFRHHHPFLVSTQYLAVNGEAMKARIFFERVLTTLSKITDVPLKDSLKFYYVAFKGFELLYKQFGYFEISEQMFFVTKNKNFKVWCSKNIRNNGPDIRGRGDQSLMVQKIIKIIEANTDSLQLSQSTLSARLYDEASWSFQSANEGLRTICQQEGYLVPEYLQCFDIIDNPQVFKLLDNYTVQIPNVVDQQKVLGNNVHNNYNIVNQSPKEKKQSKGLTLYRNLQYQGRFSQQNDYPQHYYKQNMRQTYNVNIPKRYTVPNQNVTPTFEKPLLNRNTYHQNLHSRTNINSQSKNKTINNQVSPKSKRIIDSRVKNPKVTFKYESNSLGKPILQIKPYSYNPNSRPGSRESHNQNSIIKICGNSPQRNFKLRQSNDKLREISPLRSHKPLIRCQSATNHIPPRPIDRNIQNSIGKTRDHSPAGNLRTNAHNFTDSNNLQSRINFIHNTHETLNRQSHLKIERNTGQINAVQDRPFIPKPVQPCYSHEISFHQNPQNPNTYQQNKIRRTTIIDQLLHPNQNQEMQLVQNLASQNSNNYHSNQRKFDYQDLKRKVNETKEKFEKYKQNQNQTTNVTKQNNQNYQIRENLYGENQNQYKKSAQNCYQRKKQQNIQRPFSQIQNNNNITQNKPPKKAEHYRYKYTPEPSNQLPSFTDISDNLSIVPTFEKIPNSGYESKRNKTHIKDNSLKNNSVGRWIEESTVIKHDPNQSELKMPESKVYAHKFDEQIFSDLVKLREKRNQITV